MTETAGTLDLKIARLKHQLKVIDQRMAMSGRYPAHRKKLSLARSQLQARLAKTIEQRRLFNLLSEERTETEEGRPAISSRSPVPGPRSVPVKNSTFIPT